MKEKVKKSGNIFYGIIKFIIGALAVVGIVIMAVLQIKRKSNGKKRKT
ncbi:MAG: hypothetical protein ABIE68_00200 [bacterium]